MTENLELLNQARAAVKMAYAPYSNFQVGAAILSENDEIFVGSNVENAAYPLGCCAEASAISAMISGGSRQIQEIIVVTDTATPTSPCGGCRQRILEFSSENTMVTLASITKVFTSLPFSEFLPYTFSAKDLETK